MPKLVVLHLKRLFRGGSWEGVRICPACSTRKDYTVAREVTCSRRRVKGGSGIVETKEVSSAQDGGGDRWCPLRGPLFAGASK
jgi:hypothetical protein